MHDAVQIMIVMILLQTPKNPEVFGSIGLIKLMSESRLPSSSSPFNRFAFPAGHLRSSNRFSNQTRCWWARALMVSIFVRLRVTLFHIA